ncbi:MAG: ABC transporter ATP-binding protein [Geminicoccaceae bacterium]|nr:ABC transporter ATP-binding protein [Geminicoccaceae bacterium]
MTAVLDVQGLTVEFPTRRGTLTAVDHISFSIGEGEVLGVVGESGAGKSLTGTAVIGLLEPPGRIAAGEVRLAGKRIDNLAYEELRRIRGREIGMVFQDPLTSLNPLYTVGRQLMETIRTHTDMGEKAARDRAIEMLAEVGIPEPRRRIDQYPHQFSGGMRQRVVIAIALLARPRLIIADEPTTALDVTIQSQILKLMRQQIAEKGASMILITHDLAVVSEMADHITVLYCGKVVERGRTRELIETPAHPYTRGLIDSIPDTAHRHDRLRQIPGSIPDIRNLPTGCNFRDRCPRAQALCAEREPDLARQHATLWAACHFPLKPGETA